MLRQFSGKGTIALLTTLLLGGCAISPVTLTEDEVTAGAQDKLARVTSEQEPIAGSIDLYNAMARALKYNLDHKVEIYESSLRVRELDLAHFNLLPNVVANAGYAGRDNPLASSSFNLATNTQNFGASTSQDQRLRTGDLTFSWHVLDFGLSYIRARQAADKALIAEESRRKVVHRLMEDVRTAYWRAFSAQKLVGKLAQLERRTRTAIASASALSDDRTTSPITAITYKRELIEIQRILQELQRELSVAKFQLAALMNVKPGAHFTLVAPAAGTQLALPASDGDGMVRLAIENRPEIRDVEYRKRINANEAHAALLELLPGVQLFAGPNYDSNAFLLHEHWLSWGAKASWNVIKVFQYPARREVVHGQDAVLDQRALALTMAIMTQVHVSRARLAHFKREVEIATAYHTTQQELVQSIRSEHAANKVSEQTLLREELNGAVGEVRLDIAKSGLQGAYANLIASMGLDPRSGDVSRYGSVAEIAAALRHGGPVPAPTGAPVKLAAQKE